MKVFIGYDPRDDNAYKVCVASILRHASVPVEIIPLKDWELRRKGVYNRPYNVDERGQIWDVRTGTPCSTLFSIQRFAVPILCGYTNEWVLFIDADMMFRDDIAKLFALADDRYAVMCVKHDQRAEEGRKMDGVIQSPYAYKNWSSLMLMKPSRCEGLTHYVLNHKTAKYLHQFAWVSHDDIGELPLEWNFLAGYYSSVGKHPKNVHYTLGTPDMLGEYAVATQWDEEWWALLRGGDPTSTASVVKREVA